MSTPADAETELDVACHSGRPGTQWTTETVTGGLLAFYTPCGSEFCFADGCPEIGATVLRTLGGDGKLIHKPVAPDGGWTVVCGSCGARIASGMAENCPVCGERDALAVESVAPYREAGVSWGGPR